VSPARRFIKALVLSVFALLGLEDYNQANYPYGNDSVSFDDPFLPLVYFYRYAAFDSL
jgi:hypothetical protein